MKINSITSPIFTPLRCSSPIRPPQEPSRDTFVKSCSSSNNCSIPFLGKSNFVDGLLEKIGLNTFEHKKYFHADEEKQKYLKLSKNEKDKKFKLIPPKTRAVANESRHAAQIMRDFLNEKYGKDKWKFVSIGTSPAGIGRALEVMGEDVAYIPVSDFRFKEGYYKTHREAFFNDVKIESYLKFLKEIGMSKEAVEKSGKTLIFYDYTFTGATLRNFQDLIFDKTNLTKKEAKFRSLNKDYIAAAGKISTLESLIASDYIANNLRRSGISSYGGVPHLDCCFLEGIDMVKEGNVSGKTAQDFVFALLYTTDAKNSEKDTKPAVFSILAT